MLYRWRPSRGPIRTGIVSGLSVAKRTDAPATLPSGYGYPTTLSSRGKVVKLSIPVSVTTTSSSMRTPRRPER